LYIRNNGKGLAAVPQAAGTPSARHMSTVFGSGAAPGCHRPGTIFRRVARDLLMTSGVVAGIHVEALRVWPAEPLVAQENRASSALAARTGSVHGK
jgi:hypothetical protein